MQALRVKFRKEFEIVLSDRVYEALAKEGFVDNELGENEKSSSQVERKPLAKKQMSELLRYVGIWNFLGTWLWLEYTLATVDNFQVLYLLSLQSHVLAYFYDITIIPSTYQDKFGIC